MTWKGKNGKKEPEKLKIICCGQWKTATKSCSAALKHLGYNPCDYMQSMSEFSQVWLDYIEGKVPIESVLAEIGTAGYDVTQDVPWSLYWNELYEANGPETKVILTVRDNTERWWNSFDKFFSKTVMETDTWGFNSRSIYFNLINMGMMGPAMKRMTKLDKILMSKFYDPILYRKSYSTKECLQDIAISKQNVCKRYEDHNEIVKKTIPEENLLVWNLKDGWEPLCTFLDVPIPDVPLPKENTTGDFNWAQEYFYQDPVTRNGIKYLVCYCILIIVILFCVIYFPIKYA